MNKHSDSCKFLGRGSLSLGYLSFTGNDDSVHNYHRRVHLAKGTIDILLRWKESGSFQVRFIGCYRFDLYGLLQDGLIRYDPKDSPNSGYVRVRLFHSSDNGIYFQTNSNGPKLLVGRFTGSASPGPNVDRAQTVPIYSQSTYAGVAQW